MTEKHVFLSIADAILASGGNKGDYKTNKSHGGGSQKDVTEFDDNRIGFYQIVAGHLDEAEALLRKGQRRACHEAHNQAAKRNKPSFQHEDLPHQAV